MDIDTIIATPADAVIKGIAQRVKERRLEKDLTQKAFAKRAGIGYDAYRKFETTGAITLHNLMQCAIVLDDIAAFQALFSIKQYTSLDALIESNQPKAKKRGKRNE